MNFDAAFAKLLEHEKGYVFDRRDAGGETNLGISARSYPNENIKGMTVERAKQIYLRDFWGPAGCDAVPDGIKFDLLDVAANSGPSRAVKLLQKAAGVTADGVLGPITLQALQSMPAARLAARFNGARLEFMTDISGVQGWTTFGRGWAKRIAANLMEV